MRQVRDPFSKIIRFYSRWGDFVSKEEFMVVPDKSTDRIPKNYAHNINERYHLPAVCQKSLIRTLFEPKHEAKFKKLEFLGDAYLEFVVSVLLYEKYPESPKQILSEKLRDVICNRNLSRLCKEVGLSQVNDVDNHFKRNADIFEAYLGCVALENGVSAHFSHFTGGIWKSWNETSNLINQSLFTENLKKNDAPEMESSNKLELDTLNHMNFDHMNPERRITQLRNNRNRDLYELFSIQPDDYEMIRYAEKLQFLGVATLKYFVTKLFNDNFASYNVSELANMRDSSLREEKVTFLFEKLLSNPPLHSYSIISYSALNKIKKRQGHRIGSSQMKQYLGYIVATTFPFQFNQLNFKLFKTGWWECENFIKDLYASYMMQQSKKEHRKRFQNGVIVDPRYL